MGIFLLRKNTLRCPECGGYFDKNDELTKQFNYTCIECNCKLITQDEYSSYGYHADKPTVECPYCHSTNVKKITNTSKAVHTAIFGIFSMGRNSKNFHCNNCNSDF